MRTTGFHIKKFYILHTDIYVFSMDLRTKSDYLCIEH